MANGIVRPVWKHAGKGTIPPLSSLDRPPSSGRPIATNSRPPPSKPTPTHGRTTLRTPLSPKITVLSSDVLRRPTGSAGELRRMPERRCKDKAQPYTPPQRFRERTIDGRGSNHTAATRGESKPKPKTTASLAIQRIQHNEGQSETPEISTGLKRQNSNGSLTDITRVKRQRNPTSSATGSNVPERPTKRRIKASEIPDDILRMIFRIVYLQCRHWNNSLDERSKWEEGFVSVRMALMRFSRLSGEAMVFRGRLPVRTLVIPVDSLGSVTPLPSDRPGYNVLTERHALRLHTGEVVQEPWAVRVRKNHRLDTIVIQPREWNRTYQREPHEDDLVEPIGRLSDKELIAEHELCRPGKTVYMNTFCNISPVFVYWLPPASGQRPVWDARDLEELVIRTLEARLRRRLVVGIAKFIMNFAIPEHIPLFVYYFHATRMGFDFGKSRFELANNFHTRQVYFRGVCTDDMWRDSPFGCMHPDRRSREPVPMPKESLQSILEVYA
ncbi:hypothetical protein M427DRAFT_76172, partial [Gonapodya prolifera JEL478]